MRDVPEIGHTCTTILRHLETKKCVLSGHIMHKMYIMSHESSPSYCFQMPVVVMKWTLYKDPKCKPKGSLPHFGSSYPHGYCPSLIQEEKLSIKLDQG